MQNEKSYLTLILYQKLRHSWNKFVDIGGIQTLNEGVTRMAVAGIASVSFAPAIANALSVPLNLSRIG